MKRDEFKRPRPTQVAHIAFELGGLRERGIKYPVATLIVNRPFYGKEEVCRIARTLCLNVTKSKGMWYENHRLLDDIVKLKKNRKDEQEESTKRKVKYKHLTKT